MKMAEMDREQLLQLAEATRQEYEDYRRKDLNLNMSRGKPGAQQLDLALGVLEALHARSEFANSDGDDCRNYGVWNGLPEMREIFSAMIGMPAELIVLGNNSSLQLMYEIISQGYTHGYSGCTPWCRQEKLKFLCPSPGYDRHFAITEYFGIEMIPVPMGPTGPDMDLIEELVKDPAVKGCWCVPKYSNPTGITYSDETVRRFAALHPAAKDFRIMWDNAYCVHDLTNTPDTLLSLYDECLKQGTEDQAFFFASTSKITFPGAGVSALACSPRNMEDVKKRANVQTIGPNKLNQLRHILFLHDIHGVKELMEGHRAILQPKFEILWQALAENLEELDIATWSHPNGGYFINLDVPDGCARRVVELCAKAGVALTDAGATFPYGKDPRDRNIRIAPSFPPKEELEVAAQLLCVCVKLAAAEKQLGRRLVE